MNVSHPVTVIYRTRCAVPGCEATAENEMTVYRNEELPRPHFEGWRVLNGVSICPKHIVEVREPGADRPRMWINQFDDLWETSEIFERRIEQSEARGES